MIQASLRKIYRPPWQRPQPKMKGNGMVTQKPKTQGEAFQDIMILCLNDMHVLIKALDAQSIALQNYTLDDFQLLESKKIAALQKYQTNINNFLQMQKPAHQVQKNLKDIFLQSYEKLKQSLLTNQMILEATQEVQRNVITIYKKYIEEQLNNKLYGNKGLINKKLTSNDL
jgi:hypothetical protein